MGYLSNRPARDIAVSICFLTVIALLALAGVWVYRQYRNTGPYVDYAKYPVRGIDVSRHNGNIDFKRVAADGIDFVFIKASEGVTHRDSKFEENYSKAKSAGLKTGAYHFFRFNSDGIEQATNFLKAVGNRNLDLGLAIDVEKAGNDASIPPETVKERLQAMVEYMNLLGYRVMIYTNLDGYYDYMADTFPGYPLWICRFKENPIAAEWTLWQYSHHGRVAGIKGDVDLNVFCGSREEWQRFLDGDVWPYSSEANAIYK